MDDNNYFTTINEIEGEIASLKITLKMTNDPKRRSELEKEIKNLEDQLSYLKNKMKSKGNTKNEDSESTSRENSSNHNIENDYYSFDRNYDDEER